MPTRRPLLVVLASGPDEFRRWCMDSGLSRRDPEVVYADRPERLRGMTDVKIIRCRGALAHPYGEDIERLAQFIEQRSHVQVHLQPDPPHVAEAIRDIRRHGGPPARA